MANERDWNSSLTDIVDKMVANSKKSIQKKGELDKLGSLSVNEEESQTVNTQMSEPNNLGSSVNSVGNNSTI